MLLRNIKELLQVREGESAMKPVNGKSMKDLPSVSNAWILIENGRITDYGEMSRCPAYHGEHIDCEGRYVLPGFVDPHTHLVFAKTREEEFNMRLRGMGYEEIAAAGGGILNSAKRLADMSEEDLFVSAVERLEEVIATGTTAIEIKSGYGLSLEAELKMLRVIRRIKELKRIPVKSTFLGAHAFPAQFKNNHEGYIRLLIDEMLPAIAEEGLADYIDAFVERGYYSIEESRRILEAGIKHGLKPKIHVNQFSRMGGVELGVELGALSVDHLEEMGEKEISALKNSGTIPTALPSCSFFLNIPYAPARKMMEADLPLALATDYNPGSTPSGNIPFVMSLACINQKMLPEEAINATTMNAAAAIELTGELGSITRGKRANLIITRPMPNLSYWMYSFGKGNRLIEKVIAYS